MNELNVRAILIGSLVDTAGTIVAGFAFYAAVGVAYGAVSPDEQIAAVDASATLQLAQLALGLALTAAGAYVAAFIARGAERPNAFAVGVISTLIGFLFVFSAPDTSPFWAVAAGLILTIPAAFVGGEVRRSQVGGPQA